MKDMKRKNGHLKRKQIYILLQPKYMRRNNENKFQNIFID